MKDIRGMFIQSTYEQRAGSDLSLIYFCRKDRTQVFASLLNDAGQNALFGGISSSKKPFSQKSFSLKVALRPCLIALSDSKSPIQTFMTASKQFFSLVVAIVLYEQKNLSWLKSQAVMLSLVFVFCCS